MNYIIGVDEAGRGSWAGPVSAGAFLAPSNFDFSYLPGLTDSKKLSPRKREALFHRISELQEEGKCHFSYAESSNDVIDRLGIREANRQAMEQSINRLVDGLQKHSDIMILIDGRDNYTFSGISTESVRFITRGDLTEPHISAASIVAKVMRDRRLCDFSVEYPDYSFTTHKGYGTRKHAQELLSYGITSLHRKSYAPVKRLISGDS